MGHLGCECKKMKIIDSGRRNTSVEFIFGIFRELQYYSITKLHEQCEGECEKSGLLV